MITDANWAGVMQLHSLAGKLVYFLAAWEGIWHGQTDALQWLSVLQHCDTIQ
jgi:hypothetical protein